MTPHFDPQLDWNREDAILRGFWGGRPDSAADVVNDIRATHAFLSGFPGILGRPWLEIGTPPVPVTDTEAGWLALVENPVKRAENGQPEPLTGFAISLATDDDDGAPQAEFTVRVGDPRGALRTPPNMFLLTLGTDLMPTASGYPVAEEIAPVAGALLRGLVSIWCPDTAALLTRSMVRARRGASDRFPDVGSVSWFAPTIADVPLPLEGAFVEPYGDGQIVTVGSPEAPSPSFERVDELRSRLLEADRLVAAPPVQNTPPRVPELSGCSPA